MQTATAIPMKEVVRRHIKTLHEGDEFTIKKMGKMLEVKEKAVSNEISGMVQFGALTQHKDSKTKHITYKIVKNTVSAFYMKYPKGAIHVAGVDGEKRKTYYKPRTNGKFPNGATIQAKAKEEGPRIGLAKIALDGKIELFRSQIKELQTKVDALLLAKSII